MLDLDTEYRSPGFWANLGFGWYLFLLLVTLNAVPSLTEDWAPAVWIGANVVLLPASLWFAVRAIRASAENLPWYVGLGQVLTAGLLYFFSLIWGVGMHLVMWSFRSL